MRKGVLASLFLFLASTLSAQQGTVTGNVSDTLERKNLANAVVSLLHKSDSMLVRFGRTDRNGAFRLDSLPYGKYLILVTYPKFADFSDDLEVKPGAETNLLSIPLTLKSRLLTEVVIRNAAAIRIKGDTTEFVADSFKVREGATVEELLRRFPGFQVNAKGEITVQGQRVQKVLVDGEEFFGDDPTMATRNIGAKAVDKVQVYDTKSDQQQITGINNNDGKTVNIKLKEDAKKGSFGKAEAGTGFNRIYDGRLLYNKFVGKRKFSVYGTASTTNTGALGWDDRQKMGLEPDMEYDELSGNYHMYNDDGDFSNWNFKGLPESRTAGALYINRWDEEKHGINSSYRYNQLTAVNEASTLTQNILPDTLFYTNQAITSRNTIYQHAANIKYEWKPDSLNSIKFTSAGTFRITDNFQTTGSEALDESRVYINQSFRTNTNSGEKWQSDNQFQYKRLFKKKDRVMMVTARYSFMDEQQDNMLNARNVFFNDGIPAQSDTIDQRKLVDGRSQTMGTRITFSEPLSAKWALVTEYSYNQNKSLSRRNTFEKGGNNKYEVINPLFSNNFNMDAYSHTGSMIVRYNTKKFRLASGSGITTLTQRLLNMAGNNRSTYNFLRVTPQAHMNYQMKPTKNINFSYKGNTVQPNISQLQPLRENNDPLNVFIGNPNLKVGFNHSLDAGYNNFRVLKQAYFSVGIRYNATSNAITNYYTIDSYGRSIYSPVNVAGNRRWNHSGNYYRGQGEGKIYYHVYWNMNANRNVNFVNTLKNTTNSFNGHIMPGIGSNKENKYGVSISPLIGYNRSTSSIFKERTTSYFNFGGNANGFYRLPWNMEIRSEMEADVRQKISSFDRRVSLLLWHGEISKKFFKKKNGKLMLQANDILNQGRGYNRIIESNFIADERFLKLSRFVLLKFEWTFSKMPGTDGTKTE